MSLEHIGAMILVLVVVFIVGNVWFHLVEALLSRIKSLLFRHKEPPAWHPLPPEQEEHDD